MQLTLKTVHFHSCYSEFSYSEKTVIVNKFQSQRYINKTPDIMAKRNTFINNQLAHAHLLALALLVKIMYILTCLFDAIADTLSGYM